MPDSEDGQFGLETVREFGHPDYVSNTWVMSCTSNGRYLLAPTTVGKIIAWNLATGEHVATLYAHEDMEVRDILFHPSKPLLLSSGDGKCYNLIARFQRLTHSIPLSPKDGHIRIYQQFPEEGYEQLRSLEEVAAAEAAEAARLAAEAAARAKAEAEAALAAAAAEDDEDEATTSNSAAEGEITSPGSRRSSRGRRRQPVTTE